MITNMTPHAINIYAGDTPDTLPAEGAPAPLRTIAPSGQVARSAQTRREVGTVDDIPVGVSVFGGVEGLPDPVAGTWYVVSGLVLAAAADRPDLLAPARPVRDEAGRVVGCRGFDTTPAGAALLAAPDDNTPTPDNAPASMLNTWQDAKGRAFGLATIEDGVATPGALTVDRDGQPAIVVGERGRARREFVLPVRGAQAGQLVLAARVISTPSGAPALEVVDTADADVGHILVVFRTGMGFRGGNEHTGDFDKSLGVKARWPGVELGAGRIAQGAAGGMGGGDQPISLMPGGTVFRVARTGRLYGATGAHYYILDNGTLHVATRAQREAALDGVWAQSPIK